MGKTRSVSTSIKQQFGQEVLPGKKGKCPQCGGNNLSVTKDDNLAKCFGCGWIYTVGGGHEHPEFTALLDELSDYFHASLLSELTAPAYQYLTLERKIAPQVVELVTDIGMVKSFDVVPFFTKARQQVQDRLEDPDDADALKLELTFLDDQKKDLVSRIERLSGRLVFTYRDASARACSFRFREPFRKVLESYRPIKGRQGVFGIHGGSHGAWAGNTKATAIIVEGEFNLLMLLTLQVLDDGAEQPRPSFAMGSAAGADFATLARIARTVCVCFDNDAAGAGYGLVVDGSKHLSVSSFTTPGIDSDLFDFLLPFVDNAAEGLSQLEKLFAMRTHHPRDFEMLKARVKSAKSPDNVADIVFQDLKERARFFYDGQTTYLQPFITHELIPVELSSEPLKVLFHEFGINASLPAFKYVTEEIRQCGRKIAVNVETHLGSFYSATTNILYIDNGPSGVVKITADNISLEDNGVDGVLFKNTLGRPPFVLNDIGDERSILYESVIGQANVDMDDGGQDARILVYLWFLGTFFASIMPTKALLVLLGSKGSGKSSLARKMTIIHEGPLSDVVPVPKRVDGFDALASNHNILVLDNVDGSVDWLEHRLSVAATGGRPTDRKLYSDNGMASFVYRAFIALTTVTPKFGDPAVADRSVIIRLARLESPVAESRVKDAVVGNWNRIWSELVLSLQGVVRALRDSATVELKSSVRMADFAEFALRLGYSTDQFKAIEGVLDRMVVGQEDFAYIDDPLLAALLIWVPKNKGRELSSQKLFVELSEVAKLEGIEWLIKEQRSFGQRMRSSKTVLMKYFSIVARNGRARERFYTFAPREMNG